MTYVLLNEATQSYTRPPINSPDGRICNYNINIPLLKKDGYTDVDESLLTLLSSQQAEIKNGKVRDIRNDPAYIEAQKQQQIKTLLSQVILTSIGYLKKDTKVGNLLSLMGTYAAKVNNVGYLEAEKLWIYSADGSGHWNEQLTSEQFFTVFNEVTAAYEVIFRS